VTPQRHEDTHPTWPATYQIRIEGHLGPALSGWFAGWSVSLESDGDSLLTGAVADQAELHGLLRRVRDLGMPLVSVNRLDPCPSPRSQEEGD
jgi:hypothetical protein